MYELMLKKIISNCILFGTRTQYKTCIRSRPYVGYINGQILYTDTLCSPLHSNDKIINSSRCRNK